MDGENGPVASIGAENLPIAISKEKDIDQCLRLICSYSQGKHAVYHLARHSGELTDSPYVRTNYPDKWVRRYLLQNYVDVDPVVKHGFTAVFPFFWDDLKFSTGSEIDFFKDAFAHDIGISGVSIPLCDKANRKALLSISSDLPAKKWRECIEPMLPHLCEAANFIHQKVVFRKFGSPSDRPVLSPREIECLSWVACGKDGTTISMILGLSEHTVRDYLKSARFKLGCATIAHAVHEATMKGILIRYHEKPPK